MSYYRGGVGQWSWLLHRVTGVGVLVFLCLHILDTALVVLGPEHYDRVIALYRLPAFRLGEIALFAALLFHALNGLRIILMDGWVDLMALHQTLFTVQMICFVLLFVPSAWIMLQPLLK